MAGEKTIHKYGLRIYCGERNPAPLLNREHFAEKIPAPPESDKSKNVGGELIQEGRGDFLPALCSGVNPHSCFVALPRYNLGYARLQAEAMSVAKKSGDNSTGEQSGGLAKFGMNEVAVAVESVQFDYGKEPVLWVEPGRDREKLPQPQTDTPHSHTTYGGHR